jgi:hypothetical protein
VSIPPQPNFCGAANLKTYLDTNTPGTTWTCANKGTASANVVGNLTTTTTVSAVACKDGMVWSTSQVTYSFNPYAHTITIDGAEDFTDSAEALTTSGGDTAYLSWDATKLLFCFKGEPTGSTSIYEIGVDGKGLRRITDPACACECYKGSHGGQHDVAPAYLADGRFVFLSTRPSGLVPCANSGVSILHVMLTMTHPISVNHVNEFDPIVSPDGRILFGRWEYVDKNALTIQSLWSVNPDGTQETAVLPITWCSRAVLTPPSRTRTDRGLCQAQLTPRGSSP